MKFVDLFCGGGFGAKGAEKAGGRSILAVDAWEIATQTYKDNFPGATTLCAPIESLNPFKLAKTYKPQVLLASPECTSHSIARGNRLPCEQSQETALEIIPWIEAMRPRWIVIENVGRMKKWGRHSELIDFIHSRGYTVSDLMLNAADFGTPQSRKRMFIVCNTVGIKIHSDSLQTLHRRKGRAAKDVIDWSAKYKSSLLYNPKRAQATLERAERAIKALGRNKPFIIVYYGSDYAGGWQSVDDPLRTVTTLDRFGLVTWIKRTPHIRMLQPEELIKAMGAGSGFKLRHGNRRDKIRLCGNGVCSPVVEIIFRKINHIEQANYALVS